MRRVTGAIVLVFCACALLVAGCGSAGTSATGSSQPRALYPVSVNGKWGYIDKTGSLVIKPQFNSAADFSEGLAAVSKTGVKFGYIDTSGTMVIQPQFYDTNAFSEGLAAVCTGGAAPNDLSWGFIDKTGKVVIKLQKKGLVSTKLRFSGGVAGVETYQMGTTGEDIVSDLMTYIDTTGKVIWQGKGLGISAAGSGS